MDYCHFSAFKNPWLPIQKEKKMEFFFFAAKWKWTDEDKPKNVGDGLDSPT
jgi:hypothetical protein